jgi:hypothetical protein
MMSRFSAGHGQIGAIMRQTKAACFSGGIGTLLVKGLTSRIYSGALTLPSFPLSQQSSFHKIHDLLQHNGSVVDHRFFPFMSPGKSGSHRFPFVG